MFKVVERAAASQFNVNGLLRRHQSTYRQTEAFDRNIGVTLMCGG